MPAAADDGTLLNDLLGPAAAALVACTSVDRLLEAGPAQLLALGLSPRSRRRLLAAAELARRFQPPADPPMPISSPRSALPYLAPLRSSRTEVLGVLALDARQTSLGGLLRVAHGSIAHVSAEPREVFSPALQLGACSIVLAHNHPSGVPDPSLEDIEFTRAICEAGAVLGIRVLDHLVVTRRAYFSFREGGLMAAPQS